MNIKDYRIVENALEGFYIEQRITYNINVYPEGVQQKRNLFGFTKSLEAVTVEREYWQRIGMSYMFENKPFERKQEAIEYLEKLCTPDKFYYPTDFKENNE